ncbi:MAG: uracil-DNA glycosylase [Deltaproteobacteria bacterium]|nr:uracil-DNA glycosylase [Deltaproteobacteria bacterium]
MGIDIPITSSSVPDYLHGRNSKNNAVEELRNLIGDCRRCELYKSRTSIVFGEGSLQARLVFIGEGPGKEEDKAGKPFVGEAGKLLTRIIENGMGLKRSDVYICNVVKCRPPGNRDPETQEINACIPFLKRQLEIIKPEVICTLGRIAAQQLIAADFKITAERGKWRSFMDIPLMPTYHPAYILRNPSRERELKGLVWKDIREIMERLGLEVKNDG